MKEVKSSLLIARGEREPEWIILGKGRERKKTRRKIFGERKKRFCRGEENQRRERGEIFGAGK